LCFATLDHQIVFASEAHLVICIIVCYLQDPFHYCAVIQDFCHWEPWTASRIFHQVYSVIMWIQSVGSSCGNFPSVNTQSSGEVQSSGKGTFGEPCGACDVTSCKDDTLKEMNWHETHSWSLLRVACKVVDVHNKWCLRVRASTSCLFESSSQGLSHIKSIGTSLVMRLIS